MSRQAYAGPKEESIVMGTILSEAGFGWEKELRHLGRRLLDALFSDELELRNFSEIVRNLAAVDVQACVYNTICLGLHRANSSPKQRIVCLYVGMRDMYDVYINGVGSNVVCSTISGNAKASVRGTDNKQFPRLFLCLIANNRLTIHKL